jgi:hypothetical protein
MRSKPYILKLKVKGFLGKMLRASTKSFPSRGHGRGNYGKLQVK